MFFKQGGVELQGRFAVSGWYDNIVPGCSVLPLVEVNAVSIGFPFGGIIEISEEAEVTGQIVDSTGLAEITGRVTGNRIEFEKKYITGKFTKQPPVIYGLDLDDEASTDGEFIFRGGYRFSAKQQNDSGHVILSVQPSLFETRQLHGCSHGHES